MRTRFFLMSLLCCLSVMGQDIHGLIVDSDNNGVGYANVVLMAKADSAYIAGAVSSEDGHFEISNSSNIALNGCFVSVSCIGYKTEFLQLPAIWGRLYLPTRRNS